MHKEVVKDNVVYKARWQGYSKPQSIEYVPLGGRFDVYVRVDVDFDRCIERGNGILSQVD